MFTSVFCEKIIPPKKVVSKDTEFISNQNQLFIIGITSPTLIVAVCAQGHANVISHLLSRDTKGFPCFIEALTKHKNTPLTVK